MTRSPVKEAVRIAVIVTFAVGAAGYWLTSAPFDALHSNRIVGHVASAGVSSDAAETNASASRAHNGARSSTRTRRGSAAAGGQASRFAMRVAPRPSRLAADGAARSSTTGAHVLRWALLGSLVLAVCAFAGLCCAVALLPPRLRARRRRADARERYEIIPYRNDVATLDRMVQVFQALGATFNRRWFRRVLTGAPSVAFEIHVLPHSKRSARVVLSVVCTPQDALLVDSCLQIAYPDVRVGYEFTVDPQAAQDSPMWIHHIKRLKKLRPFITQVGGEPAGRGGQSFEHQLTDDLLVNLAQVNMPVTVQLVLTPVPRWVDRLARRAYREEEHAIAGRRNAGELADRSPVADAELRGGLVAQHQLLFYVDIRCASSDPGVALLAAQSLSQGTGVNRLRVKEPWLLTRLHARRIAKGVPRLLPPIRHGVLSSRELALLWQLPTQRPKSVSVKRSNLLREPVSAAVWRPSDPDDAFAHDERGPIGIRPPDRKLGVRFTGVPGAGKTTGMVSLWRGDARDRDAAVIGFDPKTEAAEAWLSHVPAERKVYFLDLARPEFGMSPLTMRASMEVIGDCVVEGLRDINEEGAIMAASDRYLRSATYGALLLADEEQRPPSWYDLYQQLWPDETGAALRERVCELCQGNSDLAGLRAFYGSILPTLLKESRSQVAIRMDAPGNKIARLLNQPTITRMLHHPVQVSIDEIIDERAVLIVQCSMGEVGEEQAVIVLLMLLRELHTALQRQQLKPSDQRIPLFWHLDEAHFVWCRLLEVILSTDRSAGLHAALAWQHAGQIEEQRMAKGILADLQTAINFRCGDPEEAEEISAQAMTAYLTRFSGEQTDRDTARITPDLPLRLTHHFALFQPVVGGEKDKPAIIHFDPMRTDIERMEHHRAAQRARGCFYPEDMPDPLPNARAQADRDDGVVAATVPRVAGSTSPRCLTRCEDQGADSSLSDGDAGGDPATEGCVEPTIVRRKRVSSNLTSTPDGTPSNQSRVVDTEHPSGEPEAAEGEPQPERNSPSREPSARSLAGTTDQIDGTVQDDEGTSVGHQPPTTFVEIDFGDVRQLVWDARRGPPPPARKPRSWKPDDVRALMMLHCHGPLLTTQLGREVWPERSERTVQRNMEVMYRHGLVNRFRMATAIRHPYIYTLAETGFTIAKQGLSDDGRRYLDPTVKFSAANDEIPDPTPLDSEWRESELKSGLYVLGNLHSAAWVLAAGQLLGDTVRRIHGSRESSCAVRPPRGFGTRAEVAMRGNRSVGDLKLERFSPIWADARLDVQVQGHHMSHWYIECDRTGRPSKNSKRFAAYDAFFNGWGHALKGYQQHLPIVIFICLNERSVLSHLAAADRELTGWVAGLVGKLEDRVYNGRQRIWFVTEIDIHRGSLRAWRVPDLPPAARRTLDYPDKMRPVIKDLAPAERLRSAVPRRDTSHRHRQPV
jgi:Replication-relaxation/TraM recognition site of TraD and TraG